MARSLNDSPYLYGIHDPGGENTMSDAGIFGWILFTEAIGCDPNDSSGKDFGQWANRGFGILVRINNGYAPAGTIPAASQYADFARRCGNYVRNSSGAHIWIIGNEMNHPIERPGIHLEGDRLVNPGESILPSMYANCYRQCRAAIKGQPGHENDQVLVGAAAPWNPSTVYDGNANGDWCKYLTDILTILGPTNCDGIAIHAYTHGTSPDLIYNDYTMNPPFQNRQYNFRAYRDFMQAIPPSMRSLPVYLTETDQDEAWADVNDGWVQQAYGEIEAWNKQSGNQKIRAVILYRWPRLDRWYLEGKQRVIEDFKQSLTYKYSWEKYLQAVEPVQPQPTPPQPAPVVSIPFPQTGKTAKGAFAAFYQTYGIDLCGYPITEEYTHPESGLKTQDWQRLAMEEYPANSGQVRLRLVGAEAVDLRQKVTDLQAQIAALRKQIEQLQQGGGAPPSAPAISDITNALPRNAAGLFKRPLDAIQYIVINHTAVRPEIGADRVAQAHITRWPGIVAQYFITGDGQVQQTNPIDEVVAQNQSWIYNGISIYVAGNFDDAIPSEAQLGALAQLCAWLMATYKLPIEAIKGAKELIGTQSPGIQWQTGQNWKGILLARIAAIQKTSATTPSRADNAAIQALQAQVTQLQQALGQAQTAINALTGERDQLKAQLAQMPNVTQLTQQIQALNLQLQAASSDKAALAQQITILQNEKAALGQQVATLSQQVQTLSQQVQTLSAANASLTQQIQTLTGDTTALKQQIQTLTSEKASLGQQIQALASEKASLGQQIVALNQTISDLRRQLTESPGGSSAPAVVPVPDITDVVDQLPKHAVNRYATRTLDKITHLTIHHSAAPPNVPIETIARYHVDTNNWPGIGYHFCIEPDGSISQVNRLETISYHAGVVNGYTIGICLEGDFRKGALPTPRQIQSAAHLAGWLSQKLNIPVENIMGHKEFPQNPTECPGDDWNTGQQWKQMLHQRVRAVLAGDLAVPAKSIGHYVLFWQRADTWAKEDYAAAVNYVARFRPTHGFSADDARTAEYVTIVGGPAGVSGEIEQKLRDAGCNVERLAGKDFADTQRMLDDLAQRGQRFQTFNV